MKIGEIKLRIIRRVGIVPSRLSSTVLGRTDEILSSGIVLKISSVVGQMRSRRIETTFWTGQNDTIRYDIPPKIVEDDIGQRADEFRRNIIEQGCYGS
jgi:hypothetical protein